MAQLKKMKAQRKHFTINYDGLKGLKVGGMVGEGERGIQTGRKGRRATLLSNSTGKIVKWWKE